MRRSRTDRTSLHDHTELRVSVRIICCILVLGLLHVASSVFIPLAFALFTIALVAPVHHWLHLRMPAPLASLLTLLMTVAGLAVFLLLAGWGFSLIAQWIIVNAARLQNLFVLQTESLHPHGTMLMGMFLDNFNASWLLRAVQEIALRVNSMVGLFVLTIIFVALGLFELDGAAGHVENLLGRRSC
ncbi:hypothetical protein [Pusillimonas noertemannii]|uniref:hypothetical protein n=1 Tax=Pusillimonas noertemannii TaxID=305977 RepID=UPI001FCBEC5F|nr:hypothetical protein [Pusillimonas noertemannii]